MKVLVVTLTHNRLDVSRRYVPGLKEKAGYPYDHVIVDNGSSDGTPDWFEDNGYTVRRNKENAGVMQGWIDGYLHALELGLDPDYVIRMDDDCEVETDGIIASIVKFYEENGDQYIVAPMNASLEEPGYEHFMPKMLSDRPQIGSWNVRVSSHAGLFVCAPRDAFDGLAMAGGVKGDSLRGKWWRDHGYTCVYLTDLRAYHRGRGTSIREPGSYQY